MQLLVCLQATQPTFTPVVDLPEGIAAFRRKLETKARYERVRASKRADASQKTERLVSGFLCRLPVLLRICPPLERSHSCEPAVVFGFGFVLKAKALSKEPQGFALGRLCSIAICVTG